MADIPQPLLLLTAREDHRWRDRLSAANELGPRLPVPLTVNWRRRVPAGRRRRWSLRQKRLKWPYFIPAPTRGPFQCICGVQLVLLSNSERATIQGSLRPEQDGPGNWTLVLPTPSYRPQCLFRLPVPLGLRRRLLDQLCHFSRMRQHSQMISR